MLGVHQPVLADEPQNAPPSAAPTTSPFVAIPKRLGAELTSDFKWSVNNLEADGEDIVTSPCHAGELLQKPAFWWTGLAAAAALGGAFALDTPVQIHTKHISHGVADTFESGGQIALWSATAVIYGWGMWTDDARSRRYMLTSVASTAIAGLLAKGAKAAFGRLRPDANQGAFQFWKGGDSFVSSAATPAFALAAGLSEWGGNRWYVAVPAYGAAAAVGFGRMGKDAHWLSDIVGSALIGVGTTELFLYLHDGHDAEPSRYRIFPVVRSDGAGIGVSWDF